MIKSLAILALVTSSLTGVASADPSDRRAANDPSGFMAIYDHHVRTSLSAPAIPTHREDFGSFSAGATARNLGY